MTYPQFLFQFFIEKNQTKSRLHCKCFGGGRNFSLYFKRSYKETESKKNSLIKRMLSLPQGTMQGRRD